MEQSIEDIRKDSLGDYRVICKVGNKPTTIEYLVRCPDCEHVQKITGSLTTRRYTLKNTKTIPCFTCDKPQIWRDYPISIGDYYELKRLFEQKTEKSI